MTATTIIIISNIMISPDPLHAASVHTHIGT